MPNRLAHERSPYLRQHADNPVDWYPWGEEAFTAAAKRDRPVLLSVGYSACHWCHVMAHESFEDPEVAGVMNDMFVNIKVDREERPDVDSIYMEATQAMTGSGGWPMTVFLAPDQRPFYAGTYFPKPRFLEVLGAVDDAWRNQRDALHGQADQLTDAIRARTSVRGSHDPDPAAVDVAVDALQSVHDAEWGGFGRAPKFPMTSNLELLMRRGAMAPVVTTLDAMASGGIYDHLGGGFHRYSVDAFWMVPHFEKMLYDNALIPRAYLQAWQITGEARFRQVVEETMGYVLRDLRSPDGGFYAAEDADSEGEEGKFYVWRPEQIEAATDHHRAATDWYGVTRAGNFEGSNILHRPVRGDLLRPPEVELARADLLEARSARIRPGLDDKVLTEWNAMFIATLAQAGAALGRSDWIGAAEQAAEHLLTHNRAGDRWLRSRGSPYLAYAADVAHLVDAFTRLSEATGQKRWIARAAACADQLLDLFWDPDEGGMWTGGRDAEALLVRTKDVYDGAVPSANSTAALALTRLGALLDEARYRDAAIRTLRMLDEYLHRAPTAVTTALAAIDVTFPGATEIVISGDRPDLVGVAHRRYLPTAVLAWGEPYSSPLWEGREQPAAYVCRNYACGLPAATPEELSAQLDR